MLELQRCRHCYGEPYTMYVNGAWVVGCNCIHTVDSGTHSYSDWDEAVLRWNKNYGLLDSVEEIGKQGISFDCTCDSRDLFWYGCRCNYAESKKNKNT